MHMQLACDQLVSTCVGWPNGEKLASTCVRIWAQPKSAQVGGQTKRKLACESVWPGLYVCAIHCNYFLYLFQQMLCERDARLPQKHFSNQTFYYRHCSTKFKKHYSNYLSFSRFTVGLNLSEWTLVITDAISVSLGKGYAPRQLLLHRAVGEHRTLCCTW